VEGSLLAVAALTQIALSGYDLWLYSAHSWTDRVYLAHFSGPLYLFVVGTILIRRFVESLNAYEKLAGVLEQRVSDKAAELERNYEQLVEARRNEALALERTRIMSEMHDGIGSQLTLALSLVRRMDREADPAHNGEDGRVATVLRESIEDLQLIIDSLEPVENDLLTVLGTLRYRLQDRLGKGGIELQWNVVDLPPLPMLTPHSVLSILRIVQEAFANCLKHSGASRIAVTTGLQGEPGIDEKAHIGIVDNGHGVDRTRGAGRGLENMRRRGPRCCSSFRRCVSAPPERFAPIWGRPAPPGLEPLPHQLHTLSGKMPACEQACMRRASAIPRDRISARVAGKAKPARCRRRNPALPFLSRFVGERS